MVPDNSSNSYWPLLIQELRPFFCPECNYSLFGKRFECKQRRK
jgi:hypothetical protein